MGTPTPHRQARRREHAAPAEGDLGPLAPLVDDPPSVGFCNAATKTLRRGERQQPSYLGSVDAFPFPADHREVPTAAIDQLRQRSDTGITTTGFNRCDRRLGHSRALRKLSL